MDKIGNLQDMIVKKPYQKRKDNIQYRKFFLKERDMEKETPEFSYMVDINRISANGTVLNLSADKSQCEALAKRFGLISVLELQAHIALSRINKKRVRVNGSFDAKVVQECGITLKPFEQRVQDKFAVVFSSEEETSVRKNEIDLDMDDEDDIEFFQGDKIDVGELVSEYFSLALDPFPHAPEAVFQSEIDDKNEKNAFSVLEKLKFK